MLNKSFHLFYIEPITKAYAVLKENILFSFKLFKDILLLKFEAQSDGDILAESFKVFRIIVVIIIFNIACKEIYEAKDSNALLELGTELFIAITYFVFFILSFYVGLLFDKIYKSKTLASFSVKLWNFYVLILITLLAIFDALSGNIEKTSLYIFCCWLFILIHVFLFFFKLIKANIFIKIQIIYIFIITLILLFEIFLFAVFCNLPLIKF